MDGVLQTQLINLNSLEEAYSYCEEIEAIKEENTELEIEDGGKELDNNGDLGDTLPKDEFEYTEYQERIPVKIIQVPTLGYEFKYNTLSTDRKIKVKGQMQVDPAKNDQMRVGFNGNLSSRRLTVKNKTNVNIVLVFTSNDIVLKTNQSLYTYQRYRAINIPVNKTAIIIKSKKDPNKFKIKLK